MSVDFQSLFHPYFQQHCKSDPSAQAENDALVCGKSYEFKGLHDVGNYEDMVSLLFLCLILSYTHFGSSL